MANEVATERTRRSKAAGTREVWEGGPDREGLASAKAKAELAAVRELQNRRKDGLALAEVD